MSLASYWGDPIQPGRHGSIGSVLGHTHTRAHVPGTEPEQKRLSARAGTSAARSEDRTHLLRLAYGDGSDFAFGEEQTGSRWEGEGEAEEEPRVTAIETILPLLCPSARGDTTEKGGAQ